MPLAETTGSTLTPSIGTEHTLAETGGDPDLPAPRNYLLRVGLGAMENGDVVELRIYSKTLSASTAREEHSVTFAHRQGIPNVVSVPVAATHYIKATLKQTAGTARELPGAWRRSMAEDTGEGMLVMRALVDHRVTFEVAEGETYLVPAERAVSLAGCGWATPNPVPEWWPSELVTHARVEAREVARVRASVTRGRPAALMRSEGPDPCRRRARGRLGRSCGPASGGSCRGGVPEAEARAVAGGVAGRVQCPMGTAPTRVDVNRLDPLECGHPLVNATPRGVPWSADRPKSGTSMHSHGRQVLTWRRRPVMATAYADDPTASCCQTNSAETM